MNDRQARVYHSLSYTDPKDTRSLMSATRLTWRAVSGALESLQELGYATAEIRDRTLHFRALPIDTETPAIPLVSQAIRTRHPLHTIWMN